MAGAAPGRSLNALPGRLIPVSAAGKERTISFRRPAGITVIVVAALVSTSTAYLLATRALATSEPADSSSDGAASPRLAVSERDHELAVQATLVCLVAAGMLPVTEAAGGRPVTRINVDRQALDIDVAEAAIARCRADSNLDAIEQARATQMRSASVTEQSAARAFLAACLEQRGTAATADGEWAYCLDDTIIATGIAPLAVVQ